MDATDGLLKLSFRIVKLNLAEMFDDLRILTATDEQLRPMINVHCAYELTRTGRIDEATAFVQSLTAEHGLECGERVLHIMAVSVKVVFLLLFFFLFVQFIYFLFEPIPIRNEDEFCRSFSVLHSMFCVSDGVRNWSIPLKCCCSVIFVGSNEYSVLQIDVSERWMAS